MKKWIQYIQAHYRVIQVIFVAGLLVGWLLFRPSGSATDRSAHFTEEESHSHPVDEITVWTCSMHPQIRQDQPGKCPICAMDLVPLKSSSGTAEGIDPDAVQMTESAMKLAEVETKTVTAGNPVGTFYLQGKVEPDERRDAELTARFGGRIEELYVNFTGQHVERGEPLATIYSPELLAAQRELQEAARFRDTRPALYESARTRLKLWDLSDQQISSMEEKDEPDQYVEIQSPISGTIMRRHVTRGDYVKEGSPLFRVTDLSHVWIMLDAYESDLPWISRGDQVDMTLAAMPGRTYSGRVTFIDPFIDPETRVARVRVEVSNAGDLLKPEMLVSGLVRSRIAGDAETLLIPASAVLWTGKRSVVYVRVPGTENPSFLYREIVLGPRAGDQYVVDKGLNEGEEIVINGVFKIDAAAQLEGKTSMMNPGGGRVPPVHDHAGMGGTMKMTDDSEAGTPEGDPGEHPAMHSMFRVGGNCAMCKDRIEEAALSVDGVISASWEIETGILHLETLEGISLERVHHAVAAAGHDTELEQAPDDVYAGLPECCLYERFSYE